MTDSDAHIFAKERQDYYPAQAYNTPAMLHLIASMCANESRILDIGCGDGQLLKLLSERYSQLELFGLTASEQERQACGGAFDVRVGDMHALPWGDEFFDVVVCRHCLEHSVSPLKAIFEANRVLRLGGVFHVVVPAPISEWVIKWKDHFSVLPKPMWEKLFDDAGFILEAFEEGDWLASFSMKREIEFRFRLRKIKDLKSFRSLSDNFDSRIVTTPLKKSTEIPTAIFNCKIAIVLHNLMLFDQVRGIANIFRNQIKFLIPITGDPEFDKMGDFTLGFILKAGFQAESVVLPANIRCDIELSPYVYGDQNVRYARWRVRFMYGLAKEAWNFSIKNNVYYDFVLTYGDYDSRIVSAYSTPIPVGNSKITPVNKQSNKHHSKPVVLYLPTYSTTSSIEAVSGASSLIKESFYVIAKAHHGTSHLEPGRLDLLEEWVDELAHHDTPLISLLEKADVVLSEGSGAIFEAVAAGVPVVVFQQKVLAGLGGTASLEERVVREGQIATATAVEDIPTAARIAIGRGASANEPLRRELFVALGDEAVRRAEKFLNELLEGGPSYDTFRAAREQLLNVIHAVEGERNAREVAEQQLHLCYRNLTDRLLADIHAIKERLIAVDRDRNDLMLAAGEHSAELEKVQTALKVAVARLRAVQRQRSERKSLAFSYSNDSDGFPDMLEVQDNNVAAAIGMNQLEPTVASASVISPVEYTNIENDTMLSITVRGHSKENGDPVASPSFRHEGSRVFGLKRAHHVPLEFIELSNHLSEGPVAFVTSALEFDEHGDLPAIILAKSLAGLGVKVAFVCWQWSDHDQLSKSDLLVYPNIFQISLYEFMKSIASLPIMTDTVASFYISFPAPIFWEAAAKLRRKGAVVAYEVNYDWEELNRDGQAHWFCKITEEQIIKEADLIFTASMSIANKLQSKRDDVIFVANGYIGEMLL